MECDMQGPMGREDPQIPGGISRGAEGGRDNNVLASFSSSI